MADSYNPGIRNISPRRLSNAEKMIRNFESMPPAIQQDWYKNPRNAKRLQDAYMLVESAPETAEPPAEESSMAVAPPITEGGPGWPPAAPPASQGPAPGMGDMAPDYNVPRQEGPQSRLSAYDEYLDMLNKNRFNPDPRLA